jgi:hypothetical protein
MLSGCTLTNKGLTTSGPPGPGVSPPHAGPGGVPVVPAGARSPPAPGSTVCGGAPSKAALRLGAARRTAYVTRSCLEPPAAPVLTVPPSPPLGSAAPALEVL